MSGASPVMAILTVWPDMTHERAVEHAAELLEHEATREAMADLYGGPFEDMTKDQAINASIAKSLREQAHYLFTNYFEHLDGLRMKKYTDAFNTLTKWYPPTEAGTDSPVDRFWRQFFAQKSPDVDVKEKEQ